MAVEVYLGNPPQHVIDWIRNHSQPSELDTPLYFEGQEAGATVAMIAWNDSAEEPEEHLQCNLECSTDGMSTWSTYNGKTIQLDNCTEKRVYFRAPVGQPNTYGFYNQENYIINGFKLEKTVKAGGNIQFLLESTGTRTDVPAYAFYRMFGIPGYNDETGEEIGLCRTLTQAPALPATTLANNCYTDMFLNCTSLAQAPELPAITLAAKCYNGMFSNCTSLTQAPALPAMALTDECYIYMFNNCNSLMSMEVSFTDWNPTAAATAYWMTDAGSQATGTKTFTCPAALPNETGDDRILSGWTRIEK